MDPTILVTGATDGLGRALSLELARRGATVLLHGRSDARLAETVAEVEQAAGSERLRTYRADFSSLADVRELGERVVAEEARLDVLINNAGIGPGPRGAAREESADGYELRFAVNYLAHFLLTNLVLPLLQRSPPSRIVNVASAGQAPIDFDNVMLERRYDGWRAYGQSKLAQIMFTFELAERLGSREEREVTVNALHPATFMNTKMVFESVGSATSSVEDGVATTLRLAVAPEVADVTGRYFEGFREALAAAQAYDAGARRRLWRLSEQLVGIDGQPPT